MDVVYDESACSMESQSDDWVIPDDWAIRINIKGRISAQVELSSGLCVSPDVLEPIYANSRLFADIYINARSSSSAIVAIVTPAASLKDLDGTPLFDFDSSLRLQQFIDAAIVECRSIATKAGLAAHEIPVAFHVELEPWTVRIEHSVFELFQAVDTVDRFKIE